MNNKSDIINVIEKIVKNVDKSPIKRTNTAEFGSEEKVSIKEYLNQNKLEEPKKESMDAPKMQPIDDLLMNFEHRDSAHDLLYNRANFKISEFEGVESNKNIYNSKSNKNVDSFAFKSNKITDTSKSNKHLEVHGYLDVSDLMNNENPQGLKFESFVESKPLQESNTGAITKLTEYQSFVNQSELRDNVSPLPEE